jgi:hypothetical protein
VVVVTSSPEVGFYNPLLLLVPSTQRHSELLRESSQVGAVACPSVEEHGKGVEWWVAQRGMCRQV